MAAPYPDMTPGPPSPPPDLLKTSFKSVPSDTRPGGSLWDTSERVGTEMKQTYKDAPPVVGSAVRDWIGNQGWLGRNVLGPAADVADVVGKGTAAAGAGITANLAELMGGGDPQKVRDAHALLQVLPVAQANAPPFAGPIVAREPSYTGSLKPSDVTPPPGGGGGGPGYNPPSSGWPAGTGSWASGGPASTSLYPPEALPTKTPADVLKIYKGQIGSAEQSGAQLTPQFTNDWVGTLDQYRKQTPAGVATGGPNAVSDLVDNLSKSANAPLDSVKSIQEVDQNIQSAINKEYGPNGLSPEGVQMRQILRDFRDRYGNIPNDQITGNRQGVDDLRTSTGTYAAYSRMKELQGVVDSTEGNPNRATLIASRVNGFLNDDSNVRGWTPEEIASARTAANSGFMQEWMRAEGSRLVGIGAAVALPGVGKLLGVPAQVGLSYAVRNAAETARLAQVQKALGVLGQRVQQPGTVPPLSPSVMPPQAVTSALRYAPSGGLLGQTANQPQDARPLPSLW